MKILFYDTKSYDKESFEATLKKFPGIQIDYIRSDLDPRTAALADGFDAVCAFVSSNVSEATLKILHEKGVRLVLLRCAGYNNVDLEKAAAYDICVMRVPGYSPEAVAEHAMALALACNRRLYKAYNKVRENDFSLAGLMGFNFYGKIAGIIGTGRIGAAMCRICNGFGMKVIAYDVYENPDLKDFVTYVTLDELLAQSDLISLHCPLMDSTYHLIQLDTIKKMKDGVILVNTSRGALVKTEDLIEGIRLHTDLTKEQARERAAKILQQVGIPDPERVLKNYPHQLSGGMSQRVMIAMAMSCNPELLIADEPTTALDVTIQAQILDLMKKIQQEEGMSILLITHDLGVVAEMCSRVIVMYAGEIVEEAPVDILFNHPSHPYTIGLIASVPKLGSGVKVLPSIPGSVPDLSMLPKGCRFAPRCKYATERCHNEEPSLFEVSPQQKCRCWLAEPTGKEDK